MVLVIIQMRLLDFRKVVLPSPRPTGSRLRSRERVLRISELLWSLHRSRLRFLDRLLRTSLLLWSLHKIPCRSGTDFSGPRSLLLYSLHRSLLRSWDRLLRISLLLRSGDRLKQIIFAMVIIYGLELRCVRLLANVRCVYFFCVFFNCMS